MKKNNLILASIMVISLATMCIVILSLSKQNNSQIASPASVYCIENNGTLEIRENENGQYGVCIKNGNECEEWEYFKGECALDISVCSVNEDCVPDSCCHPTSCITKNNAPDCLGTMCTMECRGGTLDCGQGNCECINNKCEAVFNP